MTEMQIPTFRPTSQRDMTRAMRLIMNATAMIADEARSLAETDFNESDEPAFPSMTDDYIFADDSGDDLIASLDILTLIISRLAEPLQQIEPTNLAFIFDCIDALDANDNDDDDFAAAEDRANDFFARIQAIDPRLDYAFFAPFNMI